MIRKQLLFLSSALTCWLLICLPVRSYAGDESAWTCSIAFAICLAPALLTFAWSAWALESGTPEQKLAAFLGGSGIRMFAVAGTAFFLSQRYAYLESAGFLSWVLGFYLLLLTLEIVLLLSTHATKPTASSEARPGGG